LIFIVIDEAWHKLKLLQFQWPTLAVGFFISASAEKAKVIRV
jgi:hypothetical protein